MKSFADIVRDASAHHRKLAGEFQVALTTVARWAAGTAVPPSRFQKLVIAAIEKYTKLGV